MKKIYQVVFSILLSFMILGCDDNKYDGETGLIASPVSLDEVDTSVANVYTLVIQKDSQDAYTNALSLLEATQNLQISDETSVQIAREALLNLILSYKRVESIYLAGYNSDDMRDIADFYIEQFIKGSKSQDIAGDLDEVFAGEKSIVTNALKGITALEYALFGNVESVSQVAQKMNQARIDAAVLMASNLEVQFKKVRDYYLEDETYLDSSDETINAYLNVLVDNSFRLRESRIGDAAGFTVKYKDNPDSTRLEYYNSTYSLDAIKEILTTHKRVMENGLQAIAISGNAASEADAIMNAITDALSLCDTYSVSLESELTSEKTLELYELGRTLQNNYTALINGLNFTQDIIEADGD